MSQQNVDIVRAFYAKTERGDYSFIDRESELHRLFASGFEWHTRADLPDAGAHKGYEGLGRLRAEWAEAFDDLHLDLEALKAVGLEE